MTGQSVRPPSKYSPAGHGIRKRQHVLGPLGSQEILVSWGGGGARPGCGASYRRPWSRLALEAGAWARGGAGRGSGGGAWAWGGVGLWRRGLDVGGAGLWRWGLGLGWGGALEAGAWARGGAWSPPKIGSSCICLWMRTSRALLDFL